MAKITLELDDEILGRLAEISRARQMTIEDLIRSQAENVADARHEQIPNPSHQKILETLNRPADYYESERERTYDRDLARAESYIDNRERLLALIDATEGDLGAQSWRRSSLYES